MLFTKTDPRFCNRTAPEKVEAVKVVRRFLNEDKDFDEMIFTIRRTVVLCALVWLKKHNKYYHDIIIEEDNLAWMGGEESAELKVTTVQEAEDNIPHNDKDNNSLLGMDESDVPAYGIINHDNNSDLPKKKDKDITNFISSLCEQENQNTAKNQDDLGNATISFPIVSPEAVDEYDTSFRIFCLAFPWLFPGGIGDWCDVPTTEGIKVDDWAKALLLYYDGRFSKDKMWCFYALNYVQRRQNMRQGSYFVTSFVGNDGPQTLEDLQKLVQAGDSSWIDKIAYFGNVVKGSTAYCVRDATRFIPGSTIMY
jgi:hypothetical protein